MFDNVKLENINASLLDLPEGYVIKSDDPNKLISGEIKYAYDNTAEITFNTDVIYKEVSSREFGQASKNNRLRDGGKYYVRVKDETMPVPLSDIQGSMEVYMRTDNDKKWFNAALKELGYGEYSQSGTSGSSSVGFDFGEF